MINCNIAMCIVSCVYRKLLRAKEKAVKTALRFLERKTRIMRWKMRTCFLAWKRAFLRRNQIEISVEVARAFLEQYMSRLCNEVYSLDPKYAMESAFAKLILLDVIENMITGNPGQDTYVLNWRDAYLEFECHSLRIVFGREYRPSPKDDRTASYKLAFAKAWDLLPGALAFQKF